MRRDGPLPLPWLLLAGALACTAPQPSTPAPAATTVARWGPAPDPDVREAPDAPLDPRRIRLDAAAYEGTERVCVTVFLGEEETLPAIDARAYDPPRARRLRVRCRGATGTGWAELVFDEASAPFASRVAVGQRLKVRVESGRGTEGVPVLSFVAFQSDGGTGGNPALDRDAPRSLDAPARGDAPPPTFGDERAEALLVEVPVGDDWRRVPAPSETPRACALLSVGEPDPVPVDRGYAPEATHHLPVRCRGPRGAVRVDVTFRGDQRLASLRFRRGEVVPLKPVARTASGVRARYAGP